MSSLTVIAEQRRLTFACDTAHSQVICDSKNLGKSDIFRFKDEVVEKIHQVGKDMVFIAGESGATDDVRNKINDFLNNKKHINIELLKQYAFKTYPYSECQVKAYGFSYLGITILQVINNQSIIIQLDQCKDFEPVITEPKTGEIKLLVDGFDNKRIYANAMPFFQKLQNYGFRQPEAFCTLYQNNYSEGVGGYIRVYKMDWEGTSLLKDYKLDEKDLKYVNFNEEGKAWVDKDKMNFTSHLQGASGTFQGTVQAGRVEGGVIEGAVMNASTINGTVINGSTIYGGEIYGGSITSEAGGIDYGTVTIDDGAVISSFDNGGDHIELTMGGVSFDVGIHLADGRTAYSNLQHSGVRTGITGGNYAEYLRTGINLGTPSTYNFTVDPSGNVSCKTLNINGASPLTTSNYSSYAAPLSHNQSSYTITPTLTAEGNINLLGEPNAASVTWTVANFEQKTSSDFRMKKNIFSLDNLSDDLYLSLKPKQYEFKTDGYGKGINFGFVSQQIENSFSQFGLNPFDYNLIQIEKPRTYFDEDLYVKGELHTVNYTNMIPWNTNMIQKLYKRIDDLEKRVTALETKNNTDLSENSTN
ncbi:MAG: hypothetical protein K0S47_3968 [Herbinix sp.]|jgi:hypothetical protein|nr:hypothetical protein [Herbinix sp.]